EFLSTRVAGRPDLASGGDGTAGRRVWLWETGGEYEVTAASGPLSKYVGLGAFVFGPSRESEGPELVRVPLFFEAVDSDSDGIRDFAECGDATRDGFVDDGDRFAVEACLVGVEARPEWCSGLCDATGDGTCDLDDSRLVRQVVAGVADKSQLACGLRAAQSAPPAPAPVCGLGFEAGFLLAGLAAARSRRRYSA
ncbi:MAG: hypothetical protein MJE66_08900, partial [Proteobacteria bacterium]|nr:hypothetical protein [Pseudomonadota bacterium]